MGDDFFSKIAGKVIVDFGCGEGAEAIEMALKGAKRVIGIDIREDVLQVARQKALDAGVKDTCVFATSTNELADVVVSVDAFEHFAEPAEILRIMNTLVKQTGEILVSFGPPGIIPWVDISSPFSLGHTCYSARKHLSVGGLRSRRMAQRGSGKWRAA